MRVFRSTRNDTRGSELGDFQCPHLHPGFFYASNAAKQTWSMHNVSTWFPWASPPTLKLSPPPNIGSLACTAWSRIGGVCVSPLPSRFAVQQSPSISPLAGLMGERRIFPVWRTGRGGSVSVWKGAAPPGRGSGSTDPLLPEPREAPAPCSQAVHPSQAEYAQWRSASRQ